MLPGHRCLLMNLAWGGISLPLRKPEGTRQLLRGAPPPISLGACASFVHLLLCWEKAQNVPVGLLVKSSGFYVVIRITLLAA